MILTITGHLGSGKSLLAVRIAHDYLVAGKKVASNITLNLDQLMPPRSKISATKLPYIPTEEHLQMLGQGYEGPYNEDKFGLVILDEAGTWLNSRDWGDKDRRGLFKWITHARKFGWDVALIIQDFESLDAQIRRSVTEVFVKCIRMDRVKIPYLPIKLPRLHMAKGLYGGPTGMPFKTWWARGNDYFKAYDTREAIRPETLWTEAGPLDVRAIATILPAWYLVGRYLPPRPTLGWYVDFAFRWLVAGLLLPLSWVSPRSGDTHKRRQQAWREDIAQIFPGLYPDVCMDLWRRRVGASVRKSRVLPRPGPQPSMDQAEYRLKRLQGLL